MSRRGSTQLLLLFFRSRRAVGWTAGMLGCIAVLTGIMLAGYEFPLVTPAGLAQVLRQSAWQHALAERPQAAAWPWGSKSTGSGKVLRLGLSASIANHREPGNGTAEDRPKDSAETVNSSRSELSELTVGDRITVTKSDGSSRVYRVTGKRVVDPHLAESDSHPMVDDTTLVTCLPLDPLLASSLKLIIQATRIDPPAPPQPGPEQKL